MTLREEFKTSGLGTIPETWQLIPVEKIAKEAKVRNTSKKELKVYAITKHRGLVPSLGFFTKRVYSEDLSQYKVVKRNQFAYSPIHLNEGAIGLLEDESEGLVSPLYIVFELLPPADPQFFKYLFKSHRLLSTYARLPLGSVNRRGAVRFRDFCKIVVQLPSEVEQQKITSILSTVDEAIQKTDEVIAKTQQLKKSLMRQLLVKGIGHTKFKQTEIGEIPEEWELVSLGECIDLLTGYPFGSKSYSDEGIKLVRGDNITRGVLRWGKKTRYWNSVSVDIEKYLVNEGDVLVAMDGALVGKNYAKVKAGDLPLLLVQRVARLRAINGLHQDFLYYLVQHPRFLNYVDSIKTVTAIPHISATDIRNYEIPLPNSLVEQQRISDVLGAVDSKMEKEQERKLQLGDLKRGLMQVLLTGEARVKVN